MTIYAKSTSQIVNNSTTLVTLTWDDTLPTLTTGTHRFEALFAFTSHATPDIKFSLAKGSGLSDGTAEWGEIDTFVTQVPLAFGDSKNFGSTTGNNMIVGISGLITVGSDPGTIAIQFAQNTANASDTTVLAAALEIYASEATAPVGKAADETRTSTTTLTDDGALVSATLATSTVYKVEFLLPMNSAVTPDFKMALERSGLSDAALYWNQLIAVGGGTTAAAHTFGTSVTSTASTGSDQLWGGAGLLVTGTDPGTLKVQWAQNTSDVGNTIVRAGAVLRLVS